jgi:hypothetical protein
LSLLEHTENKVGKSAIEIEPDIKKFYEILPEYLKQLGLNEKESINISCKGRGRAFLIDNECSNHLIIYG